MNGAASHAAPFLLAGQPNGMETCASILIVGIWTRSFQHNYPQTRIDMRQLLAKRPADYQ